MHKVFLYFIAVLILSGCGSMQFDVASHLFKKATVNGGVCSAGQEGHLKVGKPYSIYGVKYYPMDSSYGYMEEGIASWYGADFHGKNTANGECYDMYAVTAAHKTLPLPTKVRVTHLENGRSIVLKVNDRGPYAKGRIIDLSYGAARKLGMVKQGVGPIRVEAIGGPHHKRKGSAFRSAKKSEEFQISAKKAPIVKKKAISEPSEPSKVKSSFTQRVTNSETQEVLRPSNVDAGRAISESINVIKAQNAVSPSQVKAEELPPPPEEVPKTSSKTLIMVKLYVQVGAFSSKVNADRNLNILKNVGYKGIITLVEKDDGRVLYRVRSGPYHSIMEADEALAELVEKGFNTAVIAVGE